MLNNRKSLLGTAMAGALGAALLCGAGVARAQDYDNDSDSYRPARTESVIVNPHNHRLGVIERKQSLRGRDGSLYSEEVSLSRPVSFADLDLSSRSDFRKLELRIHATAASICAELNARDQGNNDESANRQCVDRAIQDAMNQVPQTPAG